MADTYVERYDTEQTEARKEAKRKYSEPDEDGWITVTKAKKAAKSVKLKKEDVPLIGGLNNKKKKVDLAYYTFQIKKNRQESKFSIFSVIQLKYLFQKLRNSLRSLKRTENGSRSSNRPATSSRYSFLNIFICYRCWKLAVTHKLLSHMRPSRLKRFLLKNIAYQEWSCPFLKRPLNASRIFENIKFAPIASSITWYKIPKISIRGVQLISAFSSLKSNHSRIPISQ